MSLHFAQCILCFLLMVLSDWNLSSWAEKFHCIFGDSVVASNLIKARTTQSWWRCALGRFCLQTGTLIAWLSHVTRMQDEHRWSRFGFLSVQKMWKPVSLSLEISFRNILHMERHPPLPTGHTFSKRFLSDASKHLSWKTWPIPAQSAQPCATQNLACLKTETVLIKTHGKCFSLAAFHPVPLRCSSKRSAFPHKQRGTPPQTKGLHICCEETAKNIRSFTFSRGPACSSLERGDKLSN